MPANFALAKDCQLLRNDVEGVLTLAAQLMLRTSTSSSNSSNDRPMPEPSDPTASSSPRLLAGPFIGAILTEASIRHLLLHTLVRVLVPPHRQCALLHDNKYVQLENEAAKKQRNERQQQSHDSHNANNSNINNMNTARKTAASTPSLSGDQQQQQYRVGRIVGVVPKPTAKKSSSRAADPSQHWLLAVYVGECVEPFTVNALSDDAFTEAEHRIFVRSALSINREEGSRRASVLPSQQPVLLSHEAAATVKQNIKDIRRALDVANEVALSEKENTAEAATKVSAYTAEVLQRASGVKRQREADDGNDDNGPSNADANQDGESSPAAFFGNGTASQAARLARLTEDVAARGQQLQQLRQLLQQKDQEVKSIFQQQQQMEARHRGEVDMWRAKAEEQSRAQVRAAKEAADSLEKRDRLLEEANTKLRRLAGMTTKYKQVVDAVAALLRRCDNSSSNNSSSDGAGKPMSPDEILAALQHKSLV